MSDSQAYEEVTGASDGVTVVKRFEEDEFPVPAIAFEFTSDRDEEVTVRLRDVVPEGVAVEDLGFHPEYGSEYWTIDEDEITFEKDLSANSEYTTVYGIRATGAEDVEQFLTEPTIEEVDPPLPESEKSDEVEDVVPESDDDVLRDAISGEGEIPGLDQEEEPADDEDVETLDLADPNNEGETASAAGARTTTPAASEAEGEAEGEADQQAVSVDGNLVNALATELRQNNVSAEDVKLLRRAFEIAGEEGGSIKARLERIQADVADLRAYTDALEEFLDENGTGEQLIEDFDEQLDEFEETLGTVQSRLEETDGAVTDVADELDEVSAEVDEMRSEVEEVTDEMGDVTEEVNEMSSDVEEVSDEVEDVSEDVENVESTVTDLEESMADIEEELDEVREQVSDADVVDRIDDIEEEIEDLRDWQEQIKSTFGG